MNRCTEQVKVIGEMMPGIYTLFAAKGVEQFVQPFTTEERSYISHIRRFTPQPKVSQCYKNTQRLLVADFYHGENRLVYNEGYYMSNIVSLLIPHAWLTLNDKVVDPTANLLASRWKKRYTEKPTFEYFGIPVSRELVVRNQIDIELFSPVTENWELAEEVWGKEILEKLNLGLSKSPSEAFI